jgi:hypothetical protein
MPGTSSACNASLTPSTMCGLMTATTSFILELLSGRALP